MERPCVRVPREQGEAVRQRLAAADLLDREYQICTADGAVYIPIVDPDGVPSDLDIEWRSVEPTDPQTLPRDLLGTEPSYGRLGDLALIDEDDDERAQEVAASIIESDLPIDGVLNATSKIKGEQRVRDWEVMAGEATRTVHREYGTEFLVDVTDTYFSPRLATERERVIQQISPGEHVFDLFAGVGPFAIRAAAAGATVVAVDVNPDAVHYLRENVARNDLETKVTVREGDVREVAADYAGWADRLIMNLPHSAGNFLETAKRLASEDAIIHYYDIQSTDAPFEAGETAVRSVFEPEYEVSVLHRQEVRSYAPGEVNVCLDIRVRR